MENVIRMAKKLGADDVAVKIVDAKQNQLRFANNTLTTNQFWNVQRMEIFLSWKKRVVSTSLDDFSKKNISKTLRQLIKLAKVSKPKEDYFGLAKGRFSYKKIKKTFDKKVLNTNIADKADAAINAALEHALKTAGVVYSGTGETEIITSNGVHAKSKDTKVELSIRAFREKDESGHGLSSSCTLNGFDPVAAGLKAGELAKHAAKPVDGKAGTYNVLFDRTAFADLASLVADFSSAFYVESGFSYLKGKLGKKVASPHVTMLDASNMQGGINSIPFDDEGYPTQTTPIIKNGVLDSYLHNTSTAKKYLVKSTGNAGLISPQARNVVIGAGDMDKRELLKECKNGLYITDVWYTRFQNYQTGDFSTIPRDAILVIKNGEIVGSVKNIRVSDNLQRIFENVMALGKEQQWIHWWEVETPTLLPDVVVKNVNITKSTM